MYPWLAKAVESDAVVVTAGRRLARDLIRSYAQRQLEAGIETWRTPDIHYWADWLDGLIDSADLAGPWPIRLDSTASSILWERCLGKHATDPLLSFASMVRQASLSWQRLQDWCVTLPEVSRSARNSDQQQLAKAAWTYQETLQANNWADAAMVPALVADALQSGSITAPARVIFAGFDRMTPSVKRVIGGLRERGCVVELASNERRKENVSGRSCADRQEEFRSAGHWAREYLQHSPAARVAIVCPDLEADAPAAARLVREGLAPGWQYGGESRRNAVNVSYGRRLADFPAIAVALLVLRWFENGLSTREVSMLLRSPFMAGTDLSGRSRLELELRGWPDRSWSAAAVTSVLKGRQDSDDATNWLRAVDRIVSLRAEHRGSANPAQWAEIFDRFLDEIGWPGPAAKDSAGYQLLTRWRGLLAELASTGMVTRSLSLSAAIERLRSMATDTVFQPEGSPGIVQLLGVLETSGLSFDAVWFCGLDSTRWPPPANPLTLVSRQLQEEHGMPDATSTDSLEFAESILQRIASSASTVILSWARAEGEAQLSPSPLLQKIRFRMADNPVDPGWHAKALQNVDNLVVLDPDVAPVVRSTEIINGGAYTIQTQSVDPFTAFCRGRLNIREMQRIEPGLPAALRGRLAHRVLHAFLAGKPDRSAIAGWTDEEFANRADRALSAVLVPEKKHLTLMHQKLLDLERARMRNILRKFADSESERPPFIVELLEHEFPFERFGMQFGFRVDRIDRLADNTLLVLDYKTGAPKSLLNREGELNDLQLVVYAMAAENTLSAEVGGLVLVNIDCRAITYKGTGGSVDWDAKRSDNWVPRFSAWKDGVENVLASMAQGDVRIRLDLPESDSRPVAILSRIAEFKHE